MMFPGQNIRALIRVYWIMCTYVLVCSGVPWNIIAARFYRLSSA